MIQGLVIIVIIFIYILLFRIFKYIISLLFVLSGNENSKSIKYLNKIASFLSISTIGICIFLYFYYEFGPTNSITIKNFKFDKIICKRAPDFLHMDKSKDEYFILYSCEFTNTDNDLINFRINSTLYFREFNNINEQKAVRSSIHIFDSNMNAIEFDDINLFHKGETIKEYG